MRVSGLALWLMVSAVNAAEVTVEVRNNRFDPEVVTVNVGDTVTWINRGTSHNVVATDGSFRSGAPASGAWRFSHTFTQPMSELLVRSEAAAGMSGAVVVKSTNSYQVGPAVAGAWFTEGMLGQGFTIEYVPAGKQIFATWFTYSAAREPIWAAGSAPLNGNRVTVPMGTFSNGNFVQTGSPPATPFASVSFTFSDCNTARAEWTRLSPASSGTLQLKRLIPLEKCY
jgi:plastocyanin